MVKKIVISRFNNIAAILQNNRIQEIIVINNTYQVNDIYLGFVHRIFSSINAAFINLGTSERSGFIHISDIKHLKKSRNINYISEVLTVNQAILVQIVKEPTNNKGPRLTANINLFGKYLVLMPFCNTVCISHKIYDTNERSYLYALAVLVKPATVGLLVRSSAQGVNEEILLKDFDELKKQWLFIQKAAIQNNYPSLLYKDEDLIKKIVRDQYDKNLNKIIIDSDNGLKQLHYHLEKWKCISPISKLTIQLYKKPECILDQFNIKETIRKSLEAKVNLSLGGYIFIETNEALTVIDVNSGSFNKTGNSRETILRTNCYAASEIAYQLKVRNINGVIIVDFIDMQSQRDQIHLLEHFQKVLQFDDAKPQIVQLSELGLVELTRRRRRQSLVELFNGENHSFFNKNINIDCRFTNSEDNSMNKKIHSLFFSKVFEQNIKLRKSHIEYFKKHNIYKSKRYHEDTIIFNKNFIYTVPLTFYAYLLKCNSSGL